MQVGNLQNRSFSTSITAAQNNVGRLRLAMCVAHHMRRQTMLNHTRVSSPQTRVVYNDTSWKTKEPSQCSTAHRNVNSQFSLLNDDGVERLVRRLARSARRRPLQLVFRRERRVGERAALEPIPAAQPKSAHLGIQEQKQKENECLVLFHM